jgi:peptidoglycan/LPS O-acetylase OafA/YrhL
VRILSDLVLNPVSAVFFYYVAVKLKDNKILAAIGNWSFYIYLLHEPLILSTTARYLLNHNLYRSGLIAPALAVMSVTIITVFCSIFMKPHIREYSKDTGASS